MPRGASQKREREDRELEQRFERSGRCGDRAPEVAARATSFLYERESAFARRAEKTARKGKQAFEVAAEKLASAFGKELDERTSRRLGSALHWGVALGAGAAYGGLRRRLRWLRRGGGLLYGALVFLAVDELANAALGLTPGPRAFPWQAHARGLMGHLVYGATAEAELRLLEQLARRA